MRIPDSITHCVGFLAIQKTDGTYVFAGTCFFIGRDAPVGFRAYVVTAKHVIEGIRNKGVDHVFIRANRKSGDSLYYETEIKDWIYHKDNDVDIALYPNGPGIPPETDHLVFPVSNFVDQNYIDKNGVGIGDDIFMIGLFRHHHGKLRNLPIVRLGNIAAMPEEKIQTKYHLMDGYLIEVRSIGGLSGSPVFTNLAWHRAFSPVNERVGQPVSLLGLVFPIPESAKTI